ncbi:MAG TPA: tetratricopeptide repeat protein [Thermoanaerobaculia bacterium]|nr:tetratricopeptide repeat protein [Thermoanaerobaculia bacterium]
MTRRSAVFAALLLPVITSAAPRLNFIRNVPALHELAGERVTILYAIGDSNKVDTFLDVFADHTNRASTLKVENAVDHAQHLVSASTDESTLRRIRRDHPADVYLGVNAFTCTMNDHNGEGSEHDTAGDRVKRHHVWTDAVCTARIDVLDANAKRVESFTVRGEGTSPRVAEMTPEERGIALEQAARYAALSAAESVTPRRVRESIELDDTAPSFGEILAMIQADRLSDARAILETGLRQHPSSGALHFDMAAVCEALGDLQAARDHFREALRLVPGSKPYRTELDLFKRRTEKAPPKSSAALRP